MLRFQKAILVGSLLLFVHLAHAQGTKALGMVSWMDAHRSVIHVVELATGKYTAYFEDRVVVQDSFIVAGSEARMADAFNLFWVGDRGLCTAPGFLSVYELDTAAHSVRRLDATFHHGHNYLATQFVRRDTLFSFGGAGMWNRNVVLTYYSEGQRTWDSYGVATPFAAHKQAVLQDVPEYARTFSYYDAVHDIFYTNTGEDVWAYDFKRNRWRALGSNSVELGHSIDYKFQISDSTLLIQSAWQTFEVDYFHNTWYETTLPNRANTSNIMMKLPVAPFYKRGDKVITFRFNEHLSDSEFEPQLLSWFATAKDRTNLGPALRPYYIAGVRLELRYYLYLLMSTGLTIGLYVRRRKRSPEEIMEVISNNEAVLGEVERQFLHDLLVAPRTTEYMNELLALDQHSDDMQRRRRSDFLHDLNALSMRLFNSALIERIRDTKDRRIILYTIKPSMRNAVKELLHEQS